MVAAWGDERFKAPLERYLIRTAITRGGPNGPAAQSVYNAINAYARISGVDLRPKPVESMDAEKVRARYQKVLSERKR